jgi:hypothetical protein
VLLTSLLTGISTFQFGYLTGTLHEDAHAFFHVKPRGGNLRDNGFNEPDRPWHATHAKFIARRHLLRSEIEVYRVRWNYYTIRTFSNLLVQLKIRGLYCALSPVPLFRLTTIVCRGTSRPAITYTVLISVAFITDMFPHCEPFPSLVTAIHETSS